MKDHRLKPRKQAPVSKPLPLNWLLGCSQADLDEFELARLAEVADLQKELHAILDRVIDAMSQAALASWFKVQDRNSLLHAIENEETPEEWAARMIRDGQRSPEELLPLPSLPPGPAHLAASKRYASRNLAEGKCRYCPKPICRESVDMCEKHLAKARARAQQKKALSTPGSREYLYAGEVTPTHGRQLGTLQSLEKNRQKKTKALLAELGRPLDSVAVGVKAAREALLAAMPDKAHAMTQTELFEKAGVVTKTTGQRALQQLLYTKEVRRLGKGGQLDPYRYFEVIHTDGPEEKQKPPTDTFSGTRRPKHLSRTKQNSALLKMMRGEETNEE